jgi:methionyl-tRNA formyltransferase
MTRFRIGYFADGPWAHQALDRVLQDASIDVAFICTRFPSPDTVLQTAAARLSIDHFTIPKINQEEAVRRIAGYNCDLLVSMSFDQLFGKALLAQPRLGIINCHAGKLPFYRGRNVLNWVLINDEPEFGITVHFVDAGIDTGDIVAQRIYPIRDEDDYSTLLERAYAGCADLLYDSIKRFQSGRVIRTRQSSIHPLGTYCTRRMPGDERLRWDQLSRDVFNFVRALCRPGPQAQSFLGTSVVSINRVEWLPDAPVSRGVPGAVLAVDGRSCLVKTGDSYVRVVDWSGVDRLKVGDRLS